MSSMNGMGDIANRCRICFKANSSGKKVNDVLKQKDLDMIKEYLDLSVEEGDSQPNKMCLKCGKQLNIAVSFVTRLRKTNDILSQSTKLKQPILKYLRRIQKIDQDDENIPLSLVSAAIKEELTGQYELKMEDNAVEEDDFPAVSSNYGGNCDIDDKTELKHNYMTIVCEKNGVKKNMVQCLTCSLIVQNKSAFLIHNRKHTGEKPCVCKFCDRRFTQSGTLVEHIRRQHPDEEFENEHRKVKRRKDPVFICHYCGKFFAKKNYLTVHIRIHTSERPYQCSQCPKAFRRCIDFIQHRRIHSGDKPYSCHVCAKSFISHTPLKRHLLVHSEERKFKCDACGIAVKSKDSLKKHVIVMHTTDRTNVCSICNASFALKYNLKTHIRARHSEKSGICNICNREFSNLQKHSKTHSTEKAFNCLMCNRNFFTEKGLASHSLKHNTENATYSCTYENCNAAFPKQAKLDFHILKYHTNTVPHTCNHCSKGFYRLPDLRRHIKSVHPVKEVVNDPQMASF